MIKVVMVIFVTLAACVLAACDGERVAVNLKSEDVFADPDALALARAAARGNTRKIDQLVDRGVDVNAQGQYGITPLYWSMVAYNYKGFSHLIDRGADPNAPIDTNRNNIMQWAAQAESTKFLEKALAAGGDPNLPGKYGPPIFSAIRTDRKDNLVLLINSGADVNQVNSSLENPVMTAVLGGNYEFAYILIKSGSDPTIGSNIFRDTSYLLDRYGQPNEPYYNELRQLIAEFEAAN